MRRRRNWRGATLSREASDQRKPQHGAVARWAPHGNARHRDERSEAMRMMHRAYVAMRG